ncbi:hypothetical protein BV22DRAFT_1114030 [Leucogyrophana mollusca]|uniref:Uncharacterized protein n=1 Tax=Leucogyrophana mollusca TaxID=85980 RepID=A0ACB8BBH8_9AGAM|nr:hypothetical protein BV22DRAFT_1114030 [Leucogyrophana mollusca]
MSRKSWVQSLVWSSFLSCVSGKEKCPSYRDDKQATWDAKADKAAGELYLGLSPEQRIYINAVQDDPITMWSTLASIHIQERPGTRFNAWDDFFSIRKQDDEALSSLITRIEDSMSKIQELRSKDASKPCTLADLDAGLVSMAIIRSLPEEFDHFVSSLMLLKSLDKQELKAAFLAEETQRRRCADGSGTSQGDSVLAAFSGQCRCPNTVTCYFCKKPGHCTHKCKAMQLASEAHQAQQAPGQRRKRTKNANKAQESSTSSNSSSTPSTSSSNAAQGTVPTQNAQNIQAPLLI